jgi:hypothetical protein
MSANWSQYCARDEAELRGGASSRVSGVRIVIVARVAGDIIRALVGVARDSDGHSVLD